MQPDVNIDRIGNTKQSGANVVDTANQALRVNVVVGGAVAGPSINYSSFTLQDASGNLWTTTMTDAGILVTNQVYSGTAQTVFLNDVSQQASWQMTVVTGVLVKIPVTFNAGYPSVIGFLTTPSGLQSALFVSNGVFVARQPGAAQAIAISSLPITTAEAAIALQTRNAAQINEILNAILAQLKLLNMNLASAIPSAYVDADTIIMDSLPTFN